MMFEFVNRERAQASENQIPILIETQNALQALRASQMTIDAQNLEKQRSLEKEIADLRSQLTETSDRLETTLKVGSLNRIVEIARTLGEKSIGE